MATLEDPKLTSSHKHTKPTATYWAKRNRAEQLLEIR